MLTRRAFMFAKASREVRSLSPVFSAVVCDAAPRTPIQCGWSIAQVRMFMFLGIYHLRPGTSSFRRTSSLAQCCSVSPFALANDGTGRIDCTNTCAVGCALQRRPSVVQELAQTESAFLWNAGQRKEETKYTISFEFMCGTAQEVSPSVRPTFFFLLL